MFYKLDDKYQLRGWEKLPYAIVDRETKKVQFLNRADMTVLELCNGKIDLRLPLISETVRRRAEDFAEIGWVKRLAGAAPIEKDQEYHRFPARYIRTAHWSVTGRCNYRCRHCYMSAPEARLGELSHETVMDIVRQLSDCGVMQVSLTGGEALVRSDFMEIVDALLEKDIRITTIYSNGALVTEVLLEALEARGIHPEFNMSYDGQGWHDWLRGVLGAEERVKKAFLLCQAHGFPTGAEMCLHDRNKHTLRQSIRNLQNWGCTSLKVNPVSNMGAWAEHGYGESISRQELFQTYLSYIPHYYEDEMPLSLQLGGFFAASPDQPDTFAIPLMKHCTDPAVTCLCGHARGNLYISPEGRALPCMALSGMDIQQQFPLIPEIGLKKCLTDSYYMEMIDQRLSAYIQHNSDCAKCVFLSQCAGGCRASGLEQRQEDFLAPDPNACALFRDGWIPKILTEVRKARPSACIPYPFEIKEG